MFCYYHKPQSSDTSYSTRGVEDMKCNVMNISKDRKYVAMGTKLVNTV